MNDKFAAAQAAQKLTIERVNNMIAFAAAQAAQKLQRRGVARCQSFAAAQAAQKHATTYKNTR